MSAHRTIAFALCLSLIVAIDGTVAVARDRLPERRRNDDAEDAELECFECSRGELLTFDLKTGQLTRRAPPVRP